MSPIVMVGPFLMCSKLEPRGGYLHVVSFCDLQLHLLHSDNYFCHISKHTGHFTGYMQMWTDSKSEGELLKIWVRSLLESNFIQELVLTGALIKLRELIEAFINSSISLKPISRAFSTLIVITVRWPRSLSLSLLLALPPHTSCLCVVSSSSYNTVQQFVM